MGQFSKLLWLSELSQPLITVNIHAQEKRRTRKALDLKKSSDVQCQHLQEQVAKLQGEVTLLRSQLKDVTSHTHQLEMAEAQMREEFERERAELERGQGSSERESVGLRRLLESTQQQLKKEVELRHQVEHDAAKAKKGLSLSLFLSLSYCGMVYVCVPFIYYCQSGTVWKYMHAYMHVM